MPRFKIIFFLLVSLFCCYNLSGKILQIADIGSFEKEVGTLDSHSLVLFDVDYTLIVPKDAVLGPHGKDISYKFIREILGDPDLLPADKYPEGYLFGKVLATTKFVTVEEESISLIQDLQKKNVPVLALTAAEARKLGEIEDFTDFRINQLKALGFDFSKTFPTTEYIRFPKQDGQKFHPVFKSGILFSSQHPKGDVLKLFLAELNLSPKKVVFVDDRMDYLQSVENAMGEKGIEFLGLHYIAAEQLPCELDEKVAQFQFLHLAEHGEWLSDEQAKIQASLGIL